MDWASTLLFYSCNSALLYRYRFIGVLWIHNFQVGTIFVELCCCPPNCILFELQIGKSITWSFCDLVAMEPIKIRMKGKTEIYYNDSKYCSKLFFLSWSFRDVLKSRLIHAAVLLSPERQNSWYIYKIYIEYDWFGGLHYPFSLWGNCDKDNSSKHKKSTYCNLW